MLNDVIESHILSGLNPGQYKAVTSPADQILQVIAGPGTGKTKVLTSRVAYLLIHHQIQPECIIVTTFTKKAANEMKERLLILLDGYVGKKNVIDRLLIGTFHSICLKILKRHCKLIGWNDGFNIAAERDVDDILESIKIDGKTLKEIRKLEEIDVSFSFKTRISSLKSKGISVEDYLNQKDGRDIDTTLAEVYQLYNKKLKSLKLMDFDDLLVNATNLLSENNVLTRLRHVLIDEFQDTNKLQLKLIRAISSQNISSPHNVTIVGDPDQSIYGFRDAESKNFQIMKEEIYHGHQIDVINLSENYRSTQAILDISELLMDQQTDRISTKMLTSTQFTDSIPPLMAELPNVQEEGKFIAHEIHHIVESLPDTPYKYSDIVILLRSSFMSRQIERELSRYQIPYNIIKGRGFWERKEVTLIMDWLRIVCNSNDRVALLRTFKVSASGIGQVTIDKIGQIMEENYQTKGERPLNVLRRLKMGSISIPRANKEKLNLAIGPYLELIDSCLKVFKQDTNDLALKIFTMISSSKIFKENVIYSTNDQAQQQEREENVQEVMNFLQEFQDEEQEDISLTDEHLYISSTSRNSLLANFIISVDLYLTQSTNKEGQNTSKVSISTIHAAKGLEWPIIFIPGLKEGVFPSKKTISSEELIDEERRVLYVALTRAQHLCYLTTFQGSSRFLNHQICGKVINFPDHFLLHISQLKKLYQLIGKSIPNHDFLKKVIDSYRSTMSVQVEHKFTQNVEAFDQVEHKFTQKEITVFNRIKYAPGSANIKSTAVVEEVNISNERKVKRKKTLGIRRGPIGPLKFFVGK